VHLAYRAKDVLDVASVLDSSLDPQRSFDLSSNARDPITQMMYTVNS
jgi:hypothetical protein